MLLHNTTLRLAGSHLEIVQYNPVFFSFLCFTTMSILKSLSPHLSILFTHHASVKKSWYITWLECFKQPLDKLQQFSYFVFLHLKQTQTTHLLRQPAFWILLQPHLKHFMNGEWSVGTRRGRAQGRCGALFVLPAFFFRFLVYFLGLLSCWPRYAKPNKSGNKSR